MEPAASSRFPYAIVPAALGALVFALAVFAIQGAVEQERARSDAAVAERLAGTRTALERRLGLSTQVLAGLRAFVLSSDDISPVEFREFAGNISGEVPELRSLQLAPGGVVAHVFPLGANRAALGHRVLEDPSDAAAARLARDSGRTVVAGPQPLRQGGYGLIARAPIYVEAGKEREFWGFATVVIDFPGFLAAVGLDQGGSGFAAPTPRFALRGPDGSGMAGDFFAGDPAVAAGPHLSGAVNLPSGAWELYLPLDPSAGRVLFWLHVPSALLAALVGGLAEAVRRRNRVLAAAVALRMRHERELDRAGRIVEATTDLVALFDRACRVVLANPSFRALHGLDGAAGAAAAAFDPAYWRGVLEPALGRAFAGETVETVHWIGSAGGGRRCLAETCQPMRGAGGAVEGAIVTARDVTELSTIAEEQRRIFEVSLDMLCVIGFDGRFEKLNPAWGRTLGWEEPELLGASVLDFIHPEDRASMETASQALAAGYPLIDFQARFRAKDETWHWLSWFAAPDPALRSAVTAVRDISEHRLLVERLRDLALTDQLTGTATRRALWDRAEPEISRAQRHRTPLSACMLDIDHFKQVNDTWGHKTGDDVLKAIAASCQSERRQEDLFCRLGGEEFVFLLPETDAEAALAFAERVRTGIERLEIATDRGPIRRTVSIGVAALGPGDTTIEDLLRRADDALYRAKREGRNRCCLEAAGD